MRSRDSFANVMQIENNKCGQRIDKQHRSPGANLYQSVGTPYPWWDGF